jgi:hypothetical protein
MADEEVTVSAGPFSAGTSGGRMQAIRIIKCTVTVIPLAV